MTDSKKGALISVVIPCYNSGSTIVKTLDSVNAQTWPNVEIIVVDDGSSDPGTIRVLEGLSDVYVIRQDNRGLPGARNTGIRAARGLYVLPLDADDWLEPDALEKMMNCLRSHPVASFVYSDIRLEGMKSGILRKSYNLFEQLFANQLPYCVLMPRQLWENTGGYDETMRQGYEDWEFNIRLGLSGHCGCAVPEPLFHYRVSNTGMLVSTSNKIHGLLWGAIQSKHARAYRPFALVKLWWTWRKAASSYPLFIYFGWLLLHKILPSKSFSMLFIKIRRHSHSARVSSKPGKS